MSNYQVEPVDRPRALSGEAIKSLRRHQVKGISRRQLLRYSIGGAMAVWLLEVTAGTIGFIWPNLSGGFGGKVRIGSLNEMHLYDEVLRDPDVKSQPIESIMQPAFPFVDITTPVDVLANMITPQNPAVLVRDFKSDKTFIITRSDVIRVL